MGSSAEKNAGAGLHACADCGLELDADDPNISCEECGEGEQGVFGDPVIHYLLTCPTSPDVSNPTPAPLTTNETRED